MRAYVDTNILVDLVLSRQEFLPDAQRVFAIGYAGEAQLVVSALSFVNTVYLGRKYKFPTATTTSSSQPPTATAW